MKNETPKVLTIVFKNCKSINGSINDMDKFEDKNKEEENVFKKHLVRLV